MDKPTEKKEKVIISPRPPRAANEKWVPIQPVAVQSEEAPVEAPDSIPVIDPGVVPMNNEVEPPKQGLAGDNPLKTTEEK
jgi:hypothetical protein